MWTTFILVGIAVLIREVFQSWEKSYGTGGAWVFILIALGLIGFTAICISMQ